MGGGGSKGDPGLREKYQAVVTQSERDKEAAETLALREREFNNKLEHAFHETAAAEKRAHDDKLRLEREKSDIVKEAAEENFRLVMESNQRERIILREAEEKRCEQERAAHENEIRVREEIEQKREAERAAAREREERTQRETTKAINDANKEVTEMKDRTHKEITQLVIESQKSKEDLMKENQRIIEAKDAATSEKLDKLTSSYQSQVREAHDMAKQREDALHLERKAVDDKYRRDMESMSKQSKEERDKITSDYHKIIEEKDSELSRNQREKDAKLDELHKNHLSDMMKAHESYTKLQETSKSEMMRLHKEKEDVIRESAEKQANLHMQMLEMTERKNEKLFIMANASAYEAALKAKEHSELLKVLDSSKELSSVKGIKSALIDNSNESCDLWTQFDDAEEDSIDHTKKTIIDKSNAMRRNIIDLLKTIDECRSLGELKKAWTDELRKLNKAATEYSVSVRREFHKKETTMGRLHELEEQCLQLNEAILNLPDMQVESPETLIYRCAQAATITYAANKGGPKSIGAPEHNAKKNSIDGENEEEVVIEEP